MTWALPLVLDRDGKFPSARPDPLLDTARLILGVAPGERRLLPEFGWAAHFFPDLGDPLRREAAAVLAEEALARWGRHLRIERVDVLGVEGRLVELGLVRAGTASKLEIRLRDPRSGT